MAHAANIPPITVVPITCRATAPEPEAIQRGTHPRMKAKEVIKIGRSRKRARGQGRVYQRSTSFVFDFGKLNDQNGVLGNESNDHNQADLGKDVVFDLDEIGRQKQPVD